MEQPARLRVLADRWVLEVRSSTHLELECISVPAQAGRVCPVSQDESPKPQLVGNCSIVRLLQVPLDDFVRLMRVPDDFVRRRCQANGGLSCCGKYRHPRVASLPFCLRQQTQLRVCARPWAWESLPLRLSPTFHRTPLETGREQDIRPGV